MDKEISGEEKMIINEAKRRGNLKREFHKKLS